MPYKVPENPGKIPLAADGDPRVAIIILNWGSIDDTAECLESLNRTKYLNIVVIVVNQTSCPRDLELLRSVCDHSFLGIELEGNHGVCVGRNVGTRTAIDEGAEFLFYLDNDTIVEPTVLTELVRVIRRHHKIGAVQPQVWVWGSNRHQLPRQTLHCRPAQDYLLLGGALLVSRNALQQVGVFDPVYYYYCEDTDWLLRLARHDYVSLYVPTKGRVFHKATYVGRWIKQTFALRNRFLLIRRYDRIFRWPFSIHFNIVVNGLPLLKSGKRKAFARALSEGVRLMFRNPRIPGWFDSGSYSAQDDSLVGYLKALAGRAPL